jgi:hypothetical protein
MEENLSLATVHPEQPTILQLKDRKLWVNGFNNSTTFNLFSINGQKITSLHLENGINIIPDDLKSGIYILRNEKVYVKLIFE